MALVEKIAFYCMLSIFSAIFYLKWVLHICITPRCAVDWYRGLQLAKALFHLCILGLFWGVQCSSVSFFEHVFFITPEHWSPLDRAHSGGKHLLLPLPWCWNRELLHIPSPWEGEAINSLFPVNLGFLGRGHLYCQGTDWVAHSKLLSCCPVLFSRQVSQIHVLAFHDLSSRV